MRMVPIRTGVQLAVSVCEGESPALVFLHGGLGNRFNWRSQFEWAHRQGWQSLAYDLGGHGQSTPYRRYSIGRHCRDLSRLLAHVNITKPILCCHSYGVPIGLEWAARNPASGLIFIAGGTHDLTPWWESPMMTLMAGGLRKMFLLPSMQRWAQSLISAHRTPLIDLYFAENPIPIEEHSYKAMQIFWNYNFLSLRTTDDLWRLPALTITADHDLTFSFAKGEQLASRFQSSQHVHIANAGHILMAEYPDTVNAAITGWRSKIISRTPPSLDADQTPRTQI